jgi:hypothetical protein
MEKFERSKIYPEKSKELPKNVVVIERADGIFRIAYGRHDIEQRVEDIKGSDAIMLETGASGDYFMLELAEKTFRELENHIQYRKIIKFAAERNVPVFFVDIDSGTMLRFLEQLLPVAESSIALGILGSLAMDGVEILKEKKINRRDFLKIFGKTTAALYFSRRLARWAEVMWSPGEKTYLETEIILLTLRNHIMAQKLITVANKLNDELKRKPEIGSIIGAAHIGIEASLKKEDKDRILIIEKILSLTKPFLDDDLYKRLTTIARFDFKEGKWVVSEIFEDPLLAKLEKDN